MAAPQAVQRGVRQVSRQLAAGRGRHDRIPGPDQHERRTADLGQPGASVEGQRQLGLGAVGGDVRARPIDVAAQQLRREAQPELGRHRHDTTEPIQAAAGALAEEAPQRQGARAPTRQAGRVPAERGEQDQAAHAPGRGVGEGQRDGAAEGFAAHEDRLGLVAEHLERAAGETRHAALGQVQMVVEGHRVPAREQQRRVAHQQPRVTVQAGDDQDAVGHCVCSTLLAHMRGLAPGGLWRHPDFVKLWSGQTISRFGSEISQLAIPLTAALVLGASPAQMGLLGAFEFAPFLLLSLFAGVWVDRVHRRPVLIVADVGRAILLGSIPAAALAGVLRIEQLYVVGLLTGVLTVFFDVAYQAYLAVLVKREHLVEGNSKLEVSRSVAQIAGPGVAGALVQLVTAPIAVVVDAISFVASVIFLLLIGAPEPAPVRQAGTDGSVWSELREGLAVVIGNPLLRSIAGCTATSNLFGNAMQAIYVLYVTRELGLQPAVIGLIYAIRGPGALGGAVPPRWAGEPLWRR